MILNKLYAIKAKSDAADGFTLIEMIIVLLIISIVFIAAGPLTGKAFSYFTLQHTAFRMAADIREMQQRAVSESSSAYLIEFFDDRYIMKKAASGEPDKIATVRLPASVRIKNNNFPSDRLYFSINSSHGQVGGAVTINERDSGKTVFVIVAAITGRVRVSDEPPE